MSIFSCTEPNTYLGQAKWYKFDGWFRQLSKRLELWLCKSCQTISWFFVNNKMLPVYVKLGPETYQLNLPIGMQRACRHICLCIRLKSGKKMNRFFLFPESIFIIDWDKYFAIYFCFCLRISFILLLYIKWSEMDPNAGCEATDLSWNLTKPTTILSGV